jgi:hypothetical protein
VLSIVLTKANSLLAFFFFNSEYGVMEMTSLMGSIENWDLGVKPRRFSLSRSWMHLLQN